MSAALPLLSPSLEVAVLDEGVRATCAFARRGEPDRLVRPEKVLRQVDLAGGASAAIATKVHEQRACFSLYR
jgi:hypothetical protein